MELEPVWEDKMPPCKPSSAEGATASTATKYIIATAPWARPAMPPLDATSQPPPQVRADVHELDTAASAIDRAIASAEQKGIPAAVVVVEEAKGDARWHYSVTYTATRKGQYSGLYSAKSAQLITPSKVLTANEGGN